MHVLLYEQAYIAELAAQHLTPQEEEVIQEYIQDNQTNDARRCLLAKIDLLWENREMGDTEILKIYDKLGMKPKECFMKAKL